MPDTNGDILYDSVYIHNSAGKEAVVPWVGGGPLKEASGAKDVSILDLGAHNVKKHELGKNIRPTTLTKRS